ncbi:hypothetical protein VF14_12075 [Nostoc linckia z18]|uniref:Uncharacterized protein n=1 Tax=Nostoc linckia z8 TaxID=1628746 RepID=A0A9Q6ELR4_NOSLI|nr:hypothetical protein VF05_24685 [Nostoc linckia z3]PHJ70600.1 hypothetical protein VF03_21945 [Nostoc linckia z2]PHJ79740.1 hypothetical protein VF06_25065 [Nostoc linckia z4]PHK04173.1 hypothetical protein VF08_12145 [Nostoc linckia z8]PHK22322.1 hypothetical protein VF11_05885 [Nostoc linckia z14]PHK29664.1 hypothetical protein VF12_30760 [Nostoc linckia z15]PHK34839.1 hypothetical protein VF14_12075 [Nostoc linckia z18]PHK45422.1 hypothetical protein VF13_16495 [Nostoc linckia z16]
MFDAAFTSWTAFHNVILPWNFSYGLEIMTLHIFMFSLMNQETFTYLIKNYELVIIWLKVELDMLSNLVFSVVVHRTVSVN